MCSETNVSRSNQSDGSAFGLMSIFRNVTPPAYPSYNVESSLGDFQKKLNSPFRFSPCLHPLGVPWLPFVPHQNICFPFYFENKTHHTSLFISFSLIAPWLIPLSISAVSSICLLTNWELNWFEIRRMLLERKGISEHRLKKYGRKTFYLLLPHPTARHAFRFRNETFSFNHKISMTFKKFRSTL